MRKWEIEQLSLEEMKLRLEDAIRELSNLRFQHAIHQLNNPLKIRQVRREIARLKTIIHEYELGRRKTPSKEKPETVAR